MAAWLHDTLEDCNITENDLQKWGFSQNCITAIIAVTKPNNDKRPYDQVIDDIIETQNQTAILVKIADNMDNLNPHRVTELKRTNPNKSKHLTTKYKKSLKKLCAAINLDHQNILQIIEKAVPIETP